MSRTNRREVPGFLSERGNEAIKNRRFTKVLDLISDAYDEKTNPNGFISLGVSENRLMHDILVPFINQNFALSSFLMTCGDCSYGHKRLRVALADFLTKRLKAHHPIAPDQLICTPGVTSVMNATAMMLAGPGEGLLLGRPYYAAFTADIGHRTGVKTVPVSFGDDMDPFSPDAVTRYEKALVESERDGIEIRGILLCSPHNPLGRCFPRSTLLALLRFCAKHSIHFISDEIYAFSTWHNPDAPDAVRFTSVLELDLEGVIDPNLVHIWWGLSKDFGANGLRFACLISRNRPFLEAMQSNATYAWPSSATESIFHTLLTTPSFLDSYFSTNSSRISAAYSFATSILKKHGIPYSRGSNAGFFLWVDLRSPYLKYRESRNRGQKGSEMSKEEGMRIDKDIQERLLARRVYVGQGKHFGDEKGGRWRVVFTHPEGYVEEGLKRVVSALEGE